MNESPTILLVDDTPDILLFMGDLECLGYRVLHAECGERAIQQTLATTPDLILLDIHMPDMDGYEICKVLKSLAVLRAVPILFMSTNLALNTWQKIQAVGGQDFMCKPFQQSELLSKLSEYLPSHVLQPVG